MKYVKWIAGIILVLIVAGWIVVQVLSEEKPAINPTPQADQLAEEVMEGLGKRAFDSVQLISWKLRDHEYLWNKQANQAIISWGEMKVLLNLNEVDGIVYKKGEKLKPDEDDHCIQQAWEYWCNDSFWAFAHFKMKDPGTTRTLIPTVEEGAKGIMVNYKGGGVTPGDAYLWVLDKENQILGFKLWVKILPVKGVYATWSNWKTYAPGFKLATETKLSFLTIPLADFKTGQSFQEFGFDQDPFEPLSK